LSVNELQTVILHVLLQYFSVNELQTVILHVLLQ
jgi:hypothetical protein